MVIEFFSEQKGEKHHLSFLSELCPLMVFSWAWIFLGILDAECGNEGL